MAFYPRGWRPGWFSPVFGLSAGDVGPFAITTAAVVCIVVAVSITACVYKRKRALTKLETFVAVNLVGFSAALGARPDAVALARSSPAYLSSALLSLAHFPLSFWAVYDVWGTARSSSYGRFTCPYTPSTTCWRYDEHLHMVRSCTWMFAAREPCAVLARLVALGPAEARRADIVVDFRDRGSTTAAFVCAQAASGLTLLACVLTFLLHQQIRRKLTQLQHGPLAPTALCTSADLATVCAACLGMECPSCPLAARVRCEDACEPYGGRSGRRGDCCGFTRCGNARCVAGVQVSACVLYSAALVIGCAMIDRAGLQAAGLQLARGCYICAYLAAAQWLCACLAGWQYLRLLRADALVKHSLAIDPFTALPVLGSGPAYTWLEDILHGTHPASLALTQRTESSSTSVSSPLHPSPSVFGAARDSLGDHRPDAELVQAQARGLKVLRGIAVPDALTARAGVAVPTAALHVQRGSPLVVCAPRAGGAPARGAVVPNGRER